MDLLLGSFAWMAPIHSRMSKARFWKCSAFIPCRSVGGQVTPLSSLSWKLTVSSMALRCCRSLGTDVLLNLRTVTDSSASQSQPLMSVSFCLGADAASLSTAEGTAPVLDTFSNRHLMVLYSKCEELFFLPSWNSRIFFMSSRMLYFLRFSLFSGLFSCFPFLFWVPKRAEWHWHQD